MVVNKLFTYLQCVFLNKRCFNVKSSTYYFHMKTKKLVDFQICINVHLIFLLYLKFYQNFKNYNAGKLNKSYLVNIYFASPSRTAFRDLSFYFCVKVHKLGDSFIFIWKKILFHLFLFPCHILSLGSSGLNCEFIHREYRFFDKFENIIHKLR